MNLMVINGPNLNLLGRREPDIYGQTSWAEIEAELKDRAQEKRVAIHFFQSNHEGDLVDAFHKNTENTDVFILNAAAFTHTSVALADAIRACAKPVIEVHLSNIYARESYRQKSLIAPYVKGIIAGFGRMSYMLAFDAALELKR